MRDDVCRICGSETIFIGSKTGRHYRRNFSLRRCPECKFSFISNPWTDYSAIYTEDYYRGKGADPLVDYEFELERPGETIRLYEWRGIVAAVRSLVSLGPSAQWLDFGCGNGGLVRYCRSQGIEAYGFEDGAIQASGIRHGIPFLDTTGLNRCQSSFDVVSAIEVFEHIEDPVSMLRRLRGLLKPGGLLFYTTGNAESKANLLNWDYIIPEIHISFFEPETLRRALLSAGFKPEFRGYLPGFTDIIRFKVLKNLGIRRRALWQQILPWPVLARLAAARFGITHHPIGWAS